MNYYKYLLFAILAYSFISYQYFLRTETIIEIIFASALIFFVIEFISTNKYSLNIPYVSDNKKNKKKNKKSKKDDDSDDSSKDTTSDESSENKSKESLIDNDSLELIINEQDEQEIMHQQNIPPTLNY